MAADSDDQISPDDIDGDPLHIQPPDIKEEVDNGDGSITLLMEDEEPPSSPEWFDNLALTLDDAVLDDLVQTYLDLIDQDMEAREDRDKMQAEGLKKSGIAGPAPGGAQFEGASRVTHPALTEAYIDFAASAIKELFPPNGPVKTKIEGKPNKDKMDRAKRKVAFMNWQLTREIPSYRPELERLLTQLPVGGSQYMKLYWNDGRGTPDVEFIPIDDIVLPYSAHNFFDLQRKFHRMSLSEFTYNNRIQSGQYRDYSLAESYGTDFDKTASAKVTDRIEGKRDDYSGEQQERIVFEGCVYDTIEGDTKAPQDRPVPYLITIDEQSRKVLSIYRNWNEDDEKCREIEYMVDFTFIPWRGVFGLSLLQCMGGLPDALTGSLRALLDSAIINSMPGGLKLKGLPGGSTNSISPTEIKEIDAGGTTDDIRKIFMPIPFNPPSPILFELLGFLSTAAAQVVGTAEEKIADAGNNMPMGTALALIEQGAKVFSAIHARIQDSQRRCLEVLHRLNRDHLPDGKVMFGSDDDDYVTREDFEGTMDVRPVSDPNIFSETQRFAQIQFVMQSLTTAAPVMPQVVQLFDLRELYARAFEMAKIPDYEEFLPEIPKAQPMNPVDENVAMVMGKPVQAYVGQDHLAHIQVHMDFGKNPMFGASPVIQSKFTTPALNHLTDHLLIWYEETMKLDAATQAKKKPDDIDWDNTAGSAAMLAASSAVVDKAASVAFAQIPQLVAQAMQQLQASAPKPPVDPMVAVETQKVQGQQQIAQGQLSLKQQQTQADARNKIAVLQAKIQEAQQDYNLKMQQMGIDAQSDQQTAQLGAQQAMHDTAVQAHTTMATAALQSHTDMQQAVLQSKTDLARTVHDNASAQHIAEIKIKSDASTKLSDGASLTDNKE